MSLDLDEFEDNYIFFTPVRNVVATKNGFIKIGKNLIHLKKDEAFEKWGAFL